MRTLLLIEDDEATRSAMTEILSKAGWGVIASDEGRKALELATAIRPAAVVLDLVTEGMNGWEFLERRKDVPALAAVPVVVVTAHADAPLRVDAMLTKPVAPELLLSTLERLVSRGRGRRAP
jgi:two-component system, OmpR family, alkaline phosphatase synthesis response regulator PhoP